LKDKKIVQVISVRADLMMMMMMMMMMTPVQTMMHIFEQVACRPSFECPTAFKAPGI
jgi:hypothetical protein